jgi:GNAT superfamily N-acetyltransferase
MFLNYKELIRSAKFLRPAQQGETERIAEIEASSFPADEKAELAAIQMRRQQASEYFWVLGDEETGIIGYVNGTCTKLDVITHESMERHDSDGSTLVIHSVTIEERFRRKGHATFMLKAYMERIKQMHNIKLVLLLCKSQLLAFYRSCGFEIVGLSPVVHGVVSYVCRAIHSILLFILLLFFPIVIVILE